MKNQNQSQAGTQSKIFILIHKNENFNSLIRMIRKECMWRLGGVGQSEHQK